VSGKFIAAVLVAASSASAATVGVVYTKLASPRHEAAAVAVDNGSAPSALQSAVVLNASESLFEHESGEDSADPICTAAAEARGCFTVMRSSDVRLKILGYTLTIPPLWLGGDSEDQYGVTNTRSSWLGNDPPEIEFLLRPPYRYVRFAKSGAQSGAQSDGQSDSRDASTSNATATTDQNASVPWTVVEFVAPSTGGETVTRLVDDLLFDDLQPAANSAPGLPQNLAVESLWGPGVSDPTTSLPPIVTDPQASASGAPEPSTWLMLLTGAATLGWFSRRRRLALTSGTPGPSADRVG